MKKFSRGATHPAEQEEEEGNDQEGFFIAAIVLPADSTTAQELPRQKW